VIYFYRDMGRGLVLLMGFFDINVAIVLAAMAFGCEIPAKAAVIFLAGLFAKAGISITDIGCITDFWAAILLILGFFFNPPAALFIITAIIVGIKGIRSFGI
jgi:hypothetical protein